MMMTIHKNLSIKYLLAKDWTVFKVHKANLPQTAVNTKQKHIMQQQTIKTVKRLTEYTMLIKYCKQQTHMKTRIPRHTG